MYKSFLKRGIEFVITLFGILILLPIYFLVISFVFIKLGSPIFFKQSRPGINGKIFNIYKFRTMINKYDDNGILLPDKERLSKFGQFLRSTSLDEIPSLWSVLRGDMSLVGPRPLLVEYLPLYSKKQARRHEVRPGITGWAQVNGRDNLTIEQKVNFDSFYYQNKSLFFDLKIILKTIIKVIKAGGVSH